MKPTTAARETAAAAFQALSIPERGQARLTARIAAGADLKDTEVDQLARFFSEPLPTPEWEMAARLQGGTAMARQVLAQVPKPTPPVEKPTIVIQAAAGTSELDQILCDLDIALWNMDIQARAEMRGAIDLGFRSALDRVGRMVTSNTPGVDRTTPAVIVAAAATEEMLSNVNVAALIQPAISDTCATVKRAIAAWQPSALAAIENALFVDFDQEEISALERAAEAAAEVLESQLTSELNQRIGSTSFAMHIDNEVDFRIVEVPQSIIANTAAVAGGATVTQFGDVLGATRNSLGLATDGTHVGSDGIAQGPTSERLINLAFATHSTIQAGARARGINISDTLRESLREAAEVVRTWTWHREALGTVAEGNEFPGHIDLDQTRYTEEELADLDARPQSPHKHCKCALELTRSVDFAS